MTTSTDTQEPNQWNDYWTNDGAQGEVFVGKDGAAHPELAAWWQLQFERLPPSGDMVDLACGAGSVFAHLNNGHTHRLYGSDISDDALALMRERVPGVTTTVSSADQLPYADHQFSAVCSQFGVEYAGNKAFEEAARVLAPKGRLMILCHFANGYIDSRNQTHLEHARTIVSSQFIRHALALTKATFLGQQQAINEMGAQFSPAQQAVFAACKSLPTGIHHHLYMGFRQLYQRRSEYDLADIEHWLAQMDEDVEHNISRLEHMCRAANDQPGMHAITERLKAMGCRDVELNPMMLKQHDLPVAWALTATR